MNNIRLSKTAAFSGDFDTAVQKVSAALAEQGFGILTQIDVQGTLKKKIDVDYPRMLILGACNPKLAHRALLADSDVSVLMPCNVVVRETTNGDVEIVAMDPMLLTDLISHPEITAVAQDAAQRIDTAIQNTTA
ncbi:MAG: DUF302 domain-containing protein [Magnetococcales bacterium]|nr:DUF302 domain-containing protein [Magnetococcales bacterium]